MDKLSAEQLRLIADFGDASFACGSWEEIDPEIVPYEPLYARKEATEAALRAEIERLEGELRAAQEKNLHRACNGVEHDPMEGKIHGCCVICQTPWPCELQASTAQVESLKEWKDNVLSAIQNIPEFHSGQWAGIKEGWGFCFELINWTCRDRQDKSAQVAKLEIALRAQAQDHKHAIENLTHDRAMKHQEASEQRERAEQAEAQVERLQAELKIARMPTMRHSDAAWEAKLKAANERIAKLTQE